MRARCRCTDAIIHCSACVTRLGCEDRPGLVRDDPASPRTHCAAPPARPTRHHQRRRQRAKLTTPRRHASARDTAFPAARRHAARRPMAVGLIPPSSCAGRGSQLAGLPGNPVAMVTFCLRAPCAADRWAATPAPAPPPCCAPRASMRSAQEARTHRVPAAAQAVPGRRRGVHRGNQVPAC